MSALRYKLKQWGERPASVKSIAAMSVVGAVVVAATISALGQWWFSGQIAEERVDRDQDRAEDRQRVDRIGDRLVRVERRDPGLCRRSAPCRAEQRRRQRSADTAPPDPRQRRERPADQAPQPVADRPPRTVAPPPSTDRPSPGGGGDDPPPPPASTPVVVPSPTAPTAPTPERSASIVEVDVGPVDIDGSEGLVPELLPDVNLPPVDLPPVRLRLPRP